MGKFVLFLLAMASGAAVAAPVVSNVQIAADEAAHEFTVTYDLADGPAIVTLELLSNGIPIGPEQRLCLRGDVNRKVTGSSGTIVWNAGAAAPEKAFADVTAVVSAYDPDDSPDYMAVDLRSGEFSYYASTNALPGGIGSDVIHQPVLERFSTGDRFFIGTGRQFLADDDFSGFTESIAAYTFGFIEMLGIQFYKALFFLVIQEEVRRLFLLLLLNGLLLLRHRIVIAHPARARRGPVPRAAPAPASARSGW